MKGLGTAADLIDAEGYPELVDVRSDAVHHPSWYQFGGCELMDLIAGMPFSRGSAIKYLARAGRKPGADELEDLRKALECTKREIQRVETEHMQIKRFMDQEQA